MRRAGSSTPSSMPTLRSSGPREDVSHLFAAGRPVLLATLDVPFAEDATAFAVDSAVETGQPLVVVNAAEVLVTPSTFLGYGYVERDLRALLAGKAGFSTHYCGAGDVAACAASLLQSLDQAGTELQAAQGSDPAGWRADATRERIRFSGFIPDTMRWTNRPTFQQVMVFRTHR